MQKARRNPFPLLGIGLRLTVSIWFQVLLTPLKGVLFIFHSRYSSLSVVMEYLALEGGPPSFTRSFTASTLLWYGLGSSHCHVRDFHPVSCDFPDTSINAPTPCQPPATPEACSRFGLVRFRSPLLTESRLISIPVDTKMFQFSTLAPSILYIQMLVIRSACTVVTSCLIRKSADQCLFDSSPRHIAAYNVLHRLITPRHPPYTLTSLTSYVTSLNSP